MNGIVGGALWQVPLLRGHNATSPDMQDRAVQQRAKALGINRVPAVVIDGRLADCCASGPVDAGVLRRLGLGGPRK